MDVIVEFRVGLMTLTDGRLVADPRKGALRVCQVGAARRSWLGRRLLRSCYTLDTGTPPQRTLQKSGAGCCDVPRAGCLCSPVQPVPGSQQGVAMCLVRAAAATCCNLLICCGLLIGCTSHRSPHAQDEAGLTHLCWHERDAAGATAAEPAVDLVIIPGESTFSKVGCLCQLQLVVAWLVAACWLAGSVQTA